MTQALFQLSGWNQFFLLNSLLQSVRQWQLRKCRSRAATSHDWRHVPSQKLQLQSARACKNLVSRFTSCKLLTLTTLLSACCLLGEWWLEWRHTGNSCRRDFVASFNRPTMLKSSRVFSVDGWPPTSVWFPATAISSKPLISAQPQHNNNLVILSCLRVSCFV